MTLEEFMGLPKEEKPRSDLTSSLDEVETPSWHKTELEATAKRFENGEEVPIDFEEAKAILRNERR